MTTKKPTAKPKPAPNPRRQPNKNQPVTPATAPARIAVTRPPYLLESYIVAADLVRHRNAALSEIDAIDADMLAIKETANYDINLINTRAESELAARTARKEDLLKILKMTGGPVHTGPETGETVHQTLAYNRAMDAAEETQADE